MERVSVSSSSISQVGFEAASNTLEIVFTDGRAYQYFDVPENVYQALVNAASVGQYFHREIRGTYRFARV
jgi:KTSC domain-containing protein